MPFAYLLECADGSYVGSCRSLELRIWQHQEGMGSEYTRRRLPVKLVWFEEFERIEDASMTHSRARSRSRTGVERSA